MKGAIIFGIGLGLLGGIPLADLTPALQAQYGGSDCKVVIMDDPTPVANCKPPLSDSCLIECRAWMTYGSRRRLANGWRGCLSPPNICPDKQCRELRYSAPGCKASDFLEDFYDTVDSCGQPSEP